MGSCLCLCDWPPFGFWRHMLTDLLHAACAIPPVSPCALGGSAERLYSSRDSASSRTRLQKLRDNRGKPPCMACVATASHKPQGGQQCNKHGKQKAKPHYYTSPLYAAAPQLPDATDGPAMWIASVSLAGRGLGLVPARELRVDGALLRGAGARHLPHRQCDAKGVLDGGCEAVEAEEGAEHGDAEEK